MKGTGKLLLLGLLFVICLPLKADERANARELRYRPDHSDFVFQGSEPRLFNRALYGQNQSFRLETSDIPIFALYSYDGMSGHIRLALHRGGETKWLHEAESIECRYRPGLRIYRFADPMLDGGSLSLTAIARYDCQGAILRLEGSDLPEDLEWICLYGGAYGRRFTRNADLGADPPDVLYLKKDYCHYNRYEIADHRFHLWFGAREDISRLSEMELSDPQRQLRQLCGYFPAGSTLSLGSADSIAQVKGMLAAREDPDYPVLRARGRFSDKQSVDIGFSAGAPSEMAADLVKGYSDALSGIEAVRSHLRVETPDPYINAMAGALVMAADGIWESPVYLHGAIGWRVQLAGWRAAYTGDVLGWHDRAREHFRAYAASQMTTPPDKPVIMDTALNLARSAKVQGTPMYSEGYIARYPNRNTTMNHYDMNLVYIDALLRHLLWTGPGDNRETVREFWPVLKRHLAWEKRCFDADCDGLYDAYCCIWASDGLQYSGGGVTHSSAYNYLANSLAAGIAAMIGEDPGPYEQEARKIKEAVNRRLWLKEEGHWAEYQDILGNQLKHPHAGVWTIYHAIDSRLHDPFQAWQALRYVDTQIPHIPVLIKDHAAGPENRGLETIATSDWMPYYWSVNNVAQAEVMHTAMAYFQGGRPEKGFRLMKAAVMDGMFLGASPGNVGQVSFYDAARGESYRDFADPVGVYSRALVEGLFGIEPDALFGSMVLHPRFPDSWNHASIETPDLKYSFRRTETEDGYFSQWDIKTSFQPYHDLGHVIYPGRDFRFHLPLSRPLRRVTVNGKELDLSRQLQSTASSLWPDPIGQPVFHTFLAGMDSCHIEIVEDKNPLTRLETPTAMAPGKGCQLSVPQGLMIEDYYDPQGLLQDYNIGPEETSYRLREDCPTGHHTFFIRLRQGFCRWWQPVDMEIIPHGQLQPRAFQKTPLKAGSRQRSIDLSAWFNDKVANTFAFGKYMSPRSPYTTLQIPTQGYGDWCGPTQLPRIDDRGLRRLAGENGDRFVLPQGVAFATPSDTARDNIVYVSQWDNFPTRLSIPLSGRASQAWLLMAGTTNHMQSRMANGIVRICYRDGSCDSLPLINPDTWAPIEQDYYTDGMAFRIDTPRPLRVQLSTGLVSDDLGSALHLGGPMQRMIPGGAATVLDLPLDNKKQLSEIQIEAITIESVIGLMSLTLVE